MHVLLTLVLTVLAGALQAPGPAIVSEPQSPVVVSRSPYHFSPVQAAYFMSNHASWPNVARYLAEPWRTPWGIIVQDYGRDFLLFADARDMLHVIELTGEPIVGEIRKGPYQSPAFPVVGLP